MSNCIFEHHFEEQKIFLLTWIPLESTTFAEAALWNRVRLGHTLAAPTVVAPAEHQMRSQQPAANGWRNGGPGFSPSRRPTSPVGVLRQTTRSQHCPAPPHWGLVGRRRAFALVIRWQARREGRGGQWCGGSVERWTGGGWGRTSEYNFA